MAGYTLLRADYLNRVAGAWRGKCAGITLGAPLRGRMAPGLLRHYSQAPGQHTASPALDFPLVWLRMLEERGPDITSETLAAEWDTHLNYLQDEFAPSRFNRMRGLPAPACGAFSNVYREGTAGIMRADFWGLIAPCAPQQAAALAYADASLDHSEEGVWAAMCLAAMVSAAFSIYDAPSLLAIGLAMMPRTCRTARAIKSAMASAYEAKAWLAAREQILKEFGRPDFTDVAQNMGFLALGLLYGLGSFADTLCTGVNCGLDAEAVGGALGALMGVRLGEQALPAEWTAPLNELLIPGLGLCNIEIPSTFSELAARTAAQGERFAAASLPHLSLAENIEPEPSPEPEPEPEAIGTGTEEPAAEAPAEEASAEAQPSEPPSAEAAPEEAKPEAAPEEAVSAETAREESSEKAAAEASVQENAEEMPEPAPAPAAPALPPVPSGVAWADNTLVKPLLVASPNALVVHNEAFTFVLDTIDGPWVAFGTEKTLFLTITNKGETPYVGGIALNVPAGWRLQARTAIGQRMLIAPNGGRVRLEYRMLVPADGGRIEVTNHLTAQLSPEQGGAALQADFPLIGAACWHTIGPFENMDTEGFGRLYPPEQNPALDRLHVGRSLQTLRWEQNSFPESEMNLEPLFSRSSGVCYGQTVLHSPHARAALLSACTNSGVKVWLNGQIILTRFNKEVFRPQTKETPWTREAGLLEGQNLLLVKWVRGAEPYRFSLTISDREGLPLPEISLTAW